MQIRALIRRTDKGVTAQADRYRRFRVREFCRVSFEEYQRDPRYYEQVVDALRSGRALHGDDGMAGLAIVG